MADLPEIPLGYKPLDPTSLRVPKGPISDAFYPYCKRALEGDLNALLEFFLANWMDPELESSFYECLGFLASSPVPEHTKIIRSVMSINKRGGPFYQTPARIAEYRYSYRQLYPTAKATQEWIDLTRKERYEKFSREKAWKWYQSAIQTATEWISRAREAESATNPRSSIDVLWVQYERAFANDATKLTEHLFLLVATTATKIPKRLFTLLASTPKVAPSIATRKFAAKEAGIAAGLASRKFAQKTT